MILKSAICCVLFSQVLGKTTPRGHFNYLFEEPTDPTEQCNGVMAPKEKYFNPECPDDVPIPNKEYDNVDQQHDPESEQPTQQPTQSPSTKPTQQPTATEQPTQQPSQQPTGTQQPTDTPSVAPSNSPTCVSQMKEISSNEDNVQSEASPKAEEQSNEDSESDSEENESEESETVEEDESKASDTQLDESQSEDTTSNHDRRSRLKVKRNQTCKDPSGSDSGSAQSEDEYTSAEEGKPQKPKSKSKLGKAGFGSKLRDFTIGAIQGTTSRSDTMYLGSPSATNAAGIAGWFCTKVPRVIGGLIADCRGRRRLVTLKRLMNEIEQARQD